MDVGGGDKAPIWRGEDPPCPNVATCLETFWRSFVDIVWQRWSVSWAWSAWCSRQHC